jgi:hypothetical protein
VRTVTLQMNVRATTNLNFSISTEVIVADDEQAETSGRQAIDFLRRFAEGMGMAMNEEEQG